MPQTPPPSSYAKLTPRERQITELLAQDHVTKDIARELQIEEHTVVTHIRRAYAKLGVSTRAGLVGKVLTERLADRGRRAQD